MKNLDKTIEFLVEWSFPFVVVAIVAGLVYLSIYMTKLGPGCNCCMKHKAGERVEKIEKQLERIEKLLEKK